MNEPIYQRMEELLEVVACDLGPSECHGMLCGALCAPGPFQWQSWLRHLTGSDDLSSLLDPEQARTVIAAFVDLTRRHMESAELSFDLLLPGDDEPLPRRAEAFAAWCRGFLSGFGLAGIADLGVLSEDAREFLEDVRRFGTLDAGASGEEEDEQALSELCEFTRMGVLIVHAEAAALGRMPGASKRRH